MFGALFATLRAPEQPANLAGADACRDRGSGLHVGPHSNIKNE
jgi:hypothetical protein